MSPARAKPCGHCEGYEERLPLVTHPLFGEGPPSYHDLAHLYFDLQAVLSRLIDPLDGTREFLARNGEFTVNIALIEADQVVWGVVHAPLLQQTYWGGAALGAWRQDRAGVHAIRCVNKDQSSSPCRIVASHHHLNEATRERIERVQPHQLVQAGSSLKFCRIAEGVADLYPRLAPTCEWDTAAAQAVLEGAGGQVLDLQGHRLRYSKADVLNPHFVASAPGWAQAVL